MRAFGATEQQIAAQLAALAEARPAVDLYPDNAEPWRVFAALATQWRVREGAGALRLQGLDYAGIPGVLRMMGIARRDWPETFDALRVMESAALEVFNERRG